jgi:hypothetical protein
MIFCVWGKSKCGGTVRWFVGYCTSFGFAEALALSVHFSISLMFAGAFIG